MSLNKMRQSLNKKRYNKKRRDAYVYWSDDETKFIMDMFDHRCAYCKSENNIELDHFFPVKSGGKTRPGNMYPVCRECNRGKGGKHAQLPQAFAIRKFGFIDGNRIFQEIRRKLISHQDWYEIQFDLYSKV